jgi:hypothetical protein
VKVIAIRESSAFPGVALQRCDVEARLCYPWAEGPAFDALLRSDTGHKMLISLSASSPMHSGIPTEAQGTESLVSRDETEEFPGRDLEIPIVRYRTALRICDFRGESLGS